MLEQLEAEVLPFPATAWQVAATLPAIHFDPVDRMLVAHAIDLGLPIVTADGLMHRYPVSTILMSRPR